MALCGKRTKSTGDAMMMMMTIYVDYGDDYIGKASKTNVFFGGDLSQICLPNHPPQGFCDIWENER